MTTIEPILADLRARALLSLFPTLSGERIERDVALPILKDDVPALIRMLERAIEQRDQYLVLWKTKYADESIEMCNAKLARAYRGEK